MQFYTSKEIVDIDLYENRLNRTGKIYVDLIDIGLYSQQQACKMVTMHRLCMKHMNLHSKLGYSSLNSDSVIDFLQKTEAVPKEHFRKKGVAGDSLDKKKILIPLQKNGYAPDFLRIYIEHQECKSRSSTTTALYKRHSETEKIRGWEEMLTPIPFTANRNVNLRFNYSDENLISFPNDMRGVIKAKEGYVLAWGDFAQSDARIAYNLLLRDETNINYIKAFPNDIYAGFANWVQEFRKVELELALKKAIAFREEMIAAGHEVGTATVETQQILLNEWKPFTGFKNRAERELYKVYVLETIYGTRRHRVSEASKFISDLGRVLDSCPRYKKFWDDIKKRASFGIPLQVHCFMGHIEHVAAFDGKSINETLFKCLNYPVQGGTSEIMIVTVNRILDKFYELGYTEDDVHVYYIRHDEPVFELSKTAMKDSWILSDFSEIQVDDWTPLKLEFSFGRTYTIEERGLMQEFYLSTKLNADKLGKCQPVPPEKEYYPLDNLLEIAIKIEHPNDEEVIIAVYNVNDNSSVVRTVKVPAHVTQEEVLTKFIDKYLSNIYEASYKQLVIYNDLGLYTDNYEAAVPVVLLYRPTSNQPMHRASIIGATALYQRDNIETPLVKGNEQFVASLKKCLLFGG